jgi:AbrB family looped-hinge helix DNA binding protein
MDTMVKQWNPSLSYRLAEYAGVPDGYPFSPGSRLRLAIVPGYGIMCIGSTQNLSIEDQGMETVTVSPKFQVVIPSRIRKSLGVEPGQKVQVLLYDGRIEMIPVKPISELRGFLQGIDTSPDREADRS